MVICEICGYKTEKSLQSHINNKHGLVNDEYAKIYPGSPIYSRSYCDRLRYTNEHRDQSYRKKLSENTKRLYKNPEWVEKHNKCLKIAQGNQKSKDNHRKGTIKYYRERTKEQEDYHNSKIVESWHDLKKRDNRIKALKRAHKSVEARKNHSEAAKRYYNSLNPRERYLIRKKLKEVWAIPENREKILKLAVIGLNKANSEEGKRKQREALRESAIKGIFPSISSLNFQMQDAFIKENLFPEMEYIIETFIVDFCFPDIKLVIEVDGDYWHGNPSVYSKFNENQKRTIKKDRKEYVVLKKNGYTLLRFWEKDIKSDISSCILKIKEKIHELTR